MTKTIALAVLSLGLSACSLLQRSPESGYLYEDGYNSSSPQEFYIERQQHQKQSTLDEMGINGTQSLSEEQQISLNRRLQVKRLEKDLSSSREMKQYYSYKPYFKSDDERAYFLSLPNIEARERWAQNNGIKATETDFAPEVVSAIEKSDITIGMSRQAVVESWGDPDLVEVAGDPLYGNERWKYSKMVSSSAGYERQLRLIYFESGRVAGWESL